MGYKEPGVYLRVQNNTRGALATGTQMFPLIIGTGAAKLKKTFEMTRSLTGQVDTFPVASVVSIEHIGSLRVGASEWSQTIDEDEPLDYAFNTGENEITWETGKGPAAGASYFVTIVYEVEDDQYEPKLCSSIAEILDYYGPDIQENEVGTPICPISLGAQLALAQGARAIYVMQVKISGASVSAADYQLALDAYAKFIPGIWRIVPLDQSVEIQAVVTGHVNLMSTYEERMERCAFLGKPYTDEDPEPTEFDGDDGVLAKIGNYASGIKNKRITTIYPDKATMSLSDGVVRTLGAPYILCAIAGMTSILPVERSYTRSNILGFRDLVGVKMTRTQKNMLAEKGVMILTQEDTGNPIIIRHQLTTDISNVQSRENSILSIQDYCSKFLRSICEQYIGRYNITSEVITMITGTLNGGLNQLAYQGVIIQDGSKIDLVAQDADNPDTVIVALRVNPPYPCNYIDITLVLE